MSTGLVPESLAEAIRYHVRYSLARRPGELSPREACRAVALATRDRAVEAMLETDARYDAANVKRVYYLSMEFLVGRSLENNLSNLGLLEEARAAIAGAGGDLEAVFAAEPDAALGNGGLGRLAACFLDSMATLGIPGQGYGINYEFGLFRQEIDNGNQREKPDHWLAFGTPWQIERPEEAVLVPCYGRIEHSQDLEDHYNPLWLDWKVLIGVPHDFPIVGYGGRTVNCLRLYSARSSQDFDMEIFNLGDYIRAVEQKIASETVSKVLYPSDAMASGRELRLLQEYFLVACALRDIVRDYLRRNADIRQLASRVAIQLNDTHPALSVLELMRILVDEHAVAWDEAWEITRATCAYTNHTLMPEALEKWSVGLLERVLPRHLQLLYEINQRFLDEVRARFPGDDERARRVSLIQEGDEKQVRMAHLAIVGSHSVNGVAALHSELVKTTLVPDFHDLFPERFNNKTNGVTPRRWLLSANPPLSKLLRDTLGDAWIGDLDRLRELEPFAEDAGFREAFRAAKRANKERLARVIAETARVKADPDSLFDIQVKRIHEYKRQLLNALQIAHQYLCLAEDGQEPLVPKTYVFAGKAAPGYWAAKQIIRFITALADTVNRDPRTDDLLRVAFVPDYRVSLAEVIIPAGDLSEQISTAGTEASGTSNMKFAMNGALTIGTMDGANIEIREEVGADNVFIFGLRADEIAALQLSGGYRPTDVYERDPAVRRLLDAIDDGRFSGGDRAAFSWVRRSLVESGDRYFHLADFPSYCEAQAEASRLFREPEDWSRKAVRSVARMGRFSSDRSIREYAAGIWGVTPA
jgi:glycogen phosphorylase